MAKIALIWEMGGDLGHVVPLASVAKELKRRSHIPVLIVRDAARVLPVISDASIAYIQSPLWEKKSYDNLPPAINFADTLLRRGYSEPDALYSVALAWHNTFSLLNADCMIFDHAPTALLAARGISVPKILLGSSFSVVPRKSPLPRFAYWQKHESHENRLVDTEKQCVRVANEILSALEKPKIAALADIFESAETLIRTLPEFDVYGFREQATYVGTLVDHAAGEPPNWPLSNGPKVFAYLKPSYKYLDFILTVLGRLKASVRVYVPSFPPQFVKKYQTSTLSFASQPLALRAVAKEADFAISHAGAGTMSLFAEAGVPQFLLPMHMEQTMNARRLSDAGLGLYFPLNDEPRILQKLFQQFFSDQTIVDAATAWSAEHQPLTNQIELVCDRIEASLGN